MNRIRLAVLALLLCCAVAPCVFAQGEYNQGSREENSFRFAILATEPAIRAEMLERFVQSYPYSNHAEGALEALCNTYKAMHEAQRMKYTAQRLLGMNPNNLTGLATMAYCVHAEAAAAAPFAGAQMQEAGQFGAHCLQALWSAPKPAGITDEQWSTTRNQYQSACQQAVNDAQANPAPAGNPQQQPGTMQPAYAARLSAAELSAARIPAAIWRPEQLLSAAGGGSATSGTTGGSTTGCGSAGGAAGGATSSVSRRGGCQTGGRRRGRPSGGHQRMPGAVRGCTHGLRPGAE